MGKGDQRTRRGKINRGTYGKSRPKAAEGAKLNQAKKGKTANKTK